MLNAVIHHAMRAMSEMHLLVGRPRPALKSGKTLAGERGSYAGGRAVRAVRADPLFCCYALNLARLHWDKPDTTKVVHTGLSYYAVIVSACMSGLIACSKLF